MRVEKRVWVRRRCAGHVSGRLMLGSGTANPNAQVGDVMGCRDRHKQEHTADEFRFAVEKVCAWAEAQLKKAAAANVHSLASSLRSLRRPDADTRIGIACQA